MSTQGTIKRFALIVDHISQKKYPNLASIKSRLEEHGFSISIRTLQRDLEQIRFEFDLSVQYDKRHKGYYLESSNMQADVFYRLLELTIQTDVLLDTIAERREALQFLDLESQNTRPVGVRYLHQILSAILQQRYVVISHENFAKKRTKQMELAPVLLKEYQNRWYVIGQVKGYDDIRSFGLDRIHQLLISEEHFELSASMSDPAAHFNHTIGLSYSVGEPTAIEFSASPMQARYLETLPLHSSQQLIYEDGQKCIFSLFVVPNYEFFQKIFMMGKQVKIIKPSWLADEIKTELEVSWRQYL